MQLIYSSLNGLVRKLERPPQSMRIPTELVPTLARLLHSEKNPSGFLRPADIVADLPRNSDLPKDAILKVVRSLIAKRVLIHQLQIENRRHDPRRASTSDEL